MNTALVFLVSGCAAPQAVPIASKPMEKAPAYNGPAYQGPTIVFSQNGKLKALVARHKEPLVLREKLEGSYGDGPEWQMARNGKQLTFCATPSDVDFFNAGAVREYLFLVAPDSNAQVLLAAYGKKSVSSDAYNYTSSSFDRSGKRILVGEGVIAQGMDDPTYSWIALFDIKTRKRLFESQEFIAKMPVGARRKALSRLSLSQPALSPDGNDIVCTNSLCCCDVTGEKDSSHFKAPPISIVHFDLKHHTAELVASLNDSLVFGQTTKIESIFEMGLPDRPFHPQFVWHPTRKTFVFSGPAAPKTPGRNLFSFDLATKKITRLTSGTQNDFCPQWSLDGKSLYWLRGSYQDAQIYRADSNGQHVAQVRPDLTGVDEIQIVPRLGAWSRYRKIPVVAMAGKDK